MIESGQEGRSSPPARFRSIRALLPYGEALTASDIVWASAYRYKGSSRRFIYLFTAISAGGAVVVSQYIGSRSRKNAEQAASQIFHIAGLLSLACMAAMLLFGSSLLQAMYPETESATMEACKTYMWIVAISFPANALYNAGAAIYRAMGETKITMWASIFATVVCRTLLSFLLARRRGMGVIGIALAMVLDWCIKAVLDIARFHSGKWAKNKVI